MFNDIALGYHDDIFWNAKSPERPVSQQCSLPAVAPFRHDNQDIQIAVRPHVSSGGRAEHYYLKRLHGFDDASNDVIKQGGGRSHPILVVLRHFSTHFHTFHNTQQSERNHSKKKPQEKGERGQA